MIDKEKNGIFVPLFLISADLIQLCIHDILYGVSIRTIKGSTNTYYGIKVVVITNNK